MASNVGEDASSPDKGFDDQGYNGQIPSSGDVDCEAAQDRKPGDDHSVDGLVELCGDALSRDEKLCTGCRKFFDRIFELTDPHWQREALLHLGNDLPWHVSFSNCQDCADMGCEFCQQYSHGSTRYDEPTGGLPEPNCALLAQVHFSPSRSRAEVHFWQGSLRYVVLLIFPGRGGHGASSARFIDLGQNTGSVGTMARVKAWLTSCDSHVGCRYGRYASCGTVHDQVRQSEFLASRRLPSRLVEVSGDRDQPRCRLVDSQQITLANTKYATLSYRWGGLLPFTCNSQNLSALHNELPWNSLPKTFQDAMVTVLSLDIGYIWLDALCIVQDSPDDWTREAGTMASVYSYSYLNLAADCSANADQGLFRDRGHLLPVHISGTHSTSALVCYDKVAYAEDRVRDRSLLLGRGWILQELHLSPRILHFQSRTIRWQCDGWMANELDSFRRLVYDCAHDYKTENDPAKLWLNIGHQYVSAVTTYDSDRPIALAGLAERFCKLMNLTPEDYLCGIWRPDFASSITWYLQDSRRQETGSATPSWSWISMLKDVPYQYLGHFEPESDGRVLSLLKLLSAVAVPTASAFGPVSVAYAKVKGRLCKASVQLCTAAQLHTDENRGSYRSESPTTCLRVGGSTLSSTIDDPISQIVPSHFIGLDCPREQDALWHDCYILLCTRSHQMEYPMYRCLLLCPAQDAGCFRRIGVAYFRISESGSATYTEFWDDICTRLQSDDVEPEHYHEVDEDVRYTITLV